ncbi:hypothetical protein [Archangium lipolyticum]|uniref:hypothetical protein n=1 Tax=Archangium lipolyticum TaxID=2970465 RepID=UPI00214A2675|nr:hypothetical protein [Archangium lipolyticum]
MGLKIGGFFKSIGKKVAKGIKKFANSPLGNLVMEKGLSFIKKNAGKITDKVLGKLGKLKMKGGFGKLLKAIEPFAKKHLGDAIAKLCTKGLSLLSGIAKQASSTGDLRAMVQQLNLARAQAPAMDPTTEQMARENIFQLIAHRHAELMRQVA